MKIKSGDNVIVVAGKDKGLSGKVLRVLPSKDMLIVEGAHVVKRHQRATGQNQQGQIVEKALPIHVSNVMISDPKTKKPTRIRIEKNAGKRERITVKSGTKLD